MFCDRCSNVSTSKEQEYLVPVTVGDGTHGIAQYTLRICKECYQKLDQWLCADPAQEAGG